MVDFSEAMLILLIQSGHMVNFKFPSFPLDVTSFSQHTHNEDNDKMNTSMSIVQY